MSDEAPVTATRSPEAIEMKAEMDRRLAASRPKVEAPKVADSVVVPQPDGKTAATDSTPKAPVTPDKPTVVPEAVKPVDLSSLPDEYRSFAEKADPKLQAYLLDLSKQDREGRLRWADYTKKTTDHAEKVRFADAIYADREALDALRDIADKREQAKKPDATPLDPLTATPEQYDARQRAVAKAEAEAAVKADRDARDRQDTETRRVTTQRVEITAQAVKAFVGMGHKAEDFTTVVEPVFLRLGGWNGMQAIAAARGVEFNADFVNATLRDFVPPAAKPKESPGANGATNGNGNGASALTRGVGLAPSLDSQPPSVRLGLKLTNDSPLKDRVAHALWVANEARRAKGLPPMVVTPD